jgi:RNA recognition motif-containing protein
MNIYVSNISYTATDEALQAAFAAFGTVQSARIIRDRLSGRSRGFGFVEMENEEEGRKAIESLAGTDLMGRAISVREARPKEEGSTGQSGQGGEGGQGAPGNGERGERGERPERGGRGRGRNGNQGGNQGANNNANPNPRPEKPKEPEIVIIQRGMY